MPVRLGVENFIKNQVVQMRCGKIIKIKIHPHFNDLKQQKRVDRACDQFQKSFFLYELETPRCSASVCFSLNVEMKSRLHVLVGAEPLQGETVVCSEVAVERTERVTSGSQNNFAFAQDLSRQNGAYPLFRSLFPVQRSLEPGCQFQTRQLVEAVHYQNYFALIFQQPLAETICGRLVTKKTAAAVV